MHFGLPAGSVGPPLGQGRPHVLNRMPLWVKILLVLSLLALLGMVLTLFPSNQIAIAPHKPIDLHGRLRIDGERSEPAHGHLFLVGVTEAKVSFVQRWLLDFDPKVDFVPAPSEIAAGLDKERDTAAIVQSKDIAGAIAYDLLGIAPSITGGGAFVNSVDPTGPAAGALRPGDNIVKINGQLATTSLDVTRVVARLRPGSRVVLGVRRDNLPYKVRMRTVDPLAGDRVHRSRLGLSLTTPHLKITLPRPVALDTDDVVGPSAGLAFALAIYDAESSIDLLRGRYVVATGALALDGEVLPVGGVRQKAISVQDAGYDILIVPRANQNEAVTAVQEFCLERSQCTHVLAVNSVAEAVRYLKLASRDIDVEFAN